MMRSLRRVLGLLPALAVLVGGAFVPLRAQTPQHITVVRTYAESLEPALIQPLIDAAYKGKLLEDPLAATALLPRP